jgi:DNA-binding beta-propeller fold protein YncE
MPRLLPLILAFLLLVPAAARADDFQPVVPSCVAQAAVSGCAVAGAAFGGASDVAVSSDGRFAYVAAFNADALVVMDRSPATGALVFRSCVSQSGAGGCVAARAMDGPSDVELTPDGTQVYLATRGAGLAVFDRNAATGALTQRPARRDASSASSRRRAACRSTGSRSAKAPCRCVSGRARIRRTCTSGPRAAGC